MNNPTRGIQIGGDWLRVSGKDRATWLHNFCTADIKRLTAGDACEAFVLNGKGKIIGWIEVFCRPETIELLCASGTAATLVEHFNRYVIREDVEFRLNDNPPELFFLWGAQACQQVGQLAGVAIEPQRSTPATLNGQEVLLTPIDMIGPGVLMEIPGQSLSDVEGWFSSTGLQAGDGDDLNDHRIRHGCPKWRTDFDEDYLPQELRRDDLAISFTKGCYLGQETVARIDALGHVNRLLTTVQVEVPPGIELMLPAEVRSGEQVVGRLTSLGQVPASGDRTWGLATVKRAAAKPGTELSIAGLAATVVESLRANA